MRHNVSLENLFEDYVSQPPTGNGLTCQSEFLKVFAQTRVSPRNTYTGASLSNLEKKLEKNCRSAKNQNKNLKQTSSLKAPHRTVKPKEAKSRSCAIIWYPALVT